MTLIQEKVTQAIEILQELDTDLWLTFVRETSGVRDPVLDFLVGPRDLTWPSALILTKKGERIAIVGNLEKDEIETLGVFETVLGYDKSVHDLLRKTILKLNPEKIAINTSHGNVHAQPRVIRQNDCLARAHFDVSSGGSSLYCKQLRLDEALDFLLRG